MNTTSQQQQSPQLSICLISLEEHYLSDNNSNIEILIDSRLPSNLDSILDKNTQLLFDQDSNNHRIYIARSLDKSSVLSLIGCIRNMGWYIGASNGYTQNDIIIRKFYFEKSFDLSKIVLVEPLKSKRNSRLAFHFEPSLTTKSNNNNNNNNDNAVVANNSSSDLAEFSKAIDKAQEAMSKSNTNDEFPRPTTLKPRRSSIAEGKPSIVFKQLAERRKVTINSSHPLDPKFDNNSDENTTSTLKPPSLAESRLFNRTSSSPPPPLRNSVPFSNPPPEQVKSLDLPKKGNVGGLASKFAGQLFFQPGAPPPIIKKNDIELTSGDNQLSTLTTSRPITEKKRRPTAERRSMYVASMKAPLVASASFDENDPKKLSQVKEGEGRDSVLNENENLESKLPLNQPKNISPPPTDKKLLNSNPLSDNIEKNQEKNNIENKGIPLPPSIPPKPPTIPNNVENQSIQKNSQQQQQPPPPPPPSTDNKVNNSRSSSPPPPPPQSNIISKPPPPPPPTQSQPILVENKVSSTPLPPPILQKTVAPPPLPISTSQSSPPPPPSPAKSVPPPVLNKPLPPPPPLNPGQTPTSIQSSQPITISNERSRSRSPPPQKIQTTISQPIIENNDNNNTNIHANSNSNSSLISSSAAAISQSLTSSNENLTVETTEHEVTFSFEDNDNDNDKNSLNQDNSRASFVDLDRLSSDSAKLKNAAYFKQMREEEERKKQEKLNELSPEERERLSLEEDAAKTHDQNKVNHFAKLGKSFAVSSSSKLLSGGRGRGAVGGRGSPTVKKALP